MDDEIGKKLERTSIKTVLLVFLAVVLLLSVLLIISVFLNHDEPQMFILKYEGLSEDNSSYVVKVYERNPEGRPCNTSISCCVVVFSMYDFEMKVSDMPNSSNASTIAFVDNDKDGHISVGDVFYIGKDVLDGKQAEGTDESEFDRNNNGKDELYMFIYSCDGKIGEIEFELPEEYHYEYFWVVS